MKVYLIRHGKTVANELHVYCGQSDSPLSRAGVAQLEEKRCIGGYPDPAGLTVYTSGLTRTEQTLEILFGNLPHIREPRFMETNFGVFEMKSYQELKDDPDFIAWCTGDNESNVPPGHGAESGKMLLTRVRSAFEDILKANEDALIITHGGPIELLFMHYFPGEAENRYAAQPKNGEGYLMEFDTRGHPLSYRKIPG